MSPSSLSAVTIKIMMPLVAGSPLRCLANFEAAELGHHDVEQDQVRVELGDFRQRIFSVDRDCRLDVQPAEIRLEQLDVGLVVVGDEDAAFFGFLRHGGLMGFNWSLK